MEENQVERNEKLELEVSELWVMEDSRPCGYSRDGVGLEIEEILQKADECGNYSVKMNRGQLQGIHIGRIERVTYDSSTRFKIHPGSFGETFSFEDFLRMGKPRIILANIHIIYDADKQ